MRIIRIPNQNLIALIYQKIQDQQVDQQIDQAHQMRSEINEELLKVKEIYNAQNNTNFNRSYVIYSYKKNKKNSITIEKIVKENLGNTIDIKI